MKSEAPTLACTGKPSAAVRTERVDLTTVRFDRNAPRSFRVEVCRSLGESRFTPLRRNGRLRPALVVSPFVFTLADRYAGPTTNARLVRETIAQLGIPTALEQMASAPGCPSPTESRGTTLDRLEGATYER